MFDWDGFFEKSAKGPVMKGTLTSVPLMVSCFRFLLCGDVHAILMKVAAPSPEKTSEDEADGLMARQVAIF